MQIDYRKFKLIKIKYVIKLKKYIDQWEENCKYSR